MLFIPSDSTFRKEFRRWRVIIFVSFAVFVFICGTAVVLYFLRLSKLQKTYPRPADFLRRACKTTACSSLADLLSQTVNHSANPCSDFYKYACSNLSVGAGILRSRLARQEALNHIRSQAVMTLPASSARKKASLLYNSCVKDTSKADLEVIREFLRSYNLLLGKPVPPPVDPLRTMLTMASKIQDGIMLHLGLDFAYPLAPNERVPSNPLTHPLRLGLNAVFRRWAAWLWQNGKADYSTVVSEVLTLVWEPTFGNESSELTARAVERTESLVHVRLWTVFRENATNATKDITIPIREISNYSTHLNSDVLTTCLSADGRTYPSEMLITIAGHGVLRFLDNLLATDGIDLASYLSWELARQLSQYITDGSTEEKRRACYLTVERMLGAGATLAYQAFRDVTDRVKQDAQEIFERIRTRSVHTIRSIIARNDAEKDHLNGMARRLNDTNMTMIFPNDLKSLEQLDKQLSYVIVTNESFISNYLGISAITWERTKQRGVPDWLLWSRVGTSAVYKPGEQFMVPANYLVSPLFSTDGHLATNWGTFGWPVALEIWHVLLIEELEGMGSQTSWYMADVYSNNTRCLKRRGGSLHVASVFQATAMSDLAETLKDSLMNTSKAAKKEAVQLFFLSSCLPDCGAPTISSREIAQQCNRAVMNSFAFAEAFDCPSEKSLGYEAVCTF